MSFKGIILSYSVNISLIIDIILNNYFWFCDSGNFELRRKCREKRTLFLL
jgi:hypothetical protein